MIPDLAPYARRRFAQSVLLAGLVLGGASCGGDAPEGSTDGGSVPRAGRLARTAAALEAHRDALERQGIAPRLVSACAELTRQAAGGPYHLRPGYGIHGGDVWFLKAMNGAESASTDGEQRKRRGIDGLAALSRRLQERGIELLLVPIPRMPQIYPERVVEDLEVPSDFVGADAGTVAYLAELTEAGVEVVHLVPSFAARRVSTAEEQDRYLFHDYNSHWTARAVVLAAERIAKTVVTMQGYEPGPLREGVDWKRVHQRIEFKVPLPKGQVVPGLKVETEVWIDAILDEEGKKALRSLRASPILFLGDSNSMWYQRAGASLPDQLMARLGQRLDVLSIPGLPADGLWKNLERRGPGQTLGEKRIIIWVFEANMLLDVELAELERFAD